MWIFSFLQVNFQCDCMCSGKEYIDIFVLFNGLYIVFDLILQGKVLIFGRGMERKMGFIE